MALSDFISSFDALLYHLTGGSSGIGLATAQNFVKEGAFVYITGRRQAELDKAVKAIGLQVKAVRADSSSLADLDRLFAQIKQEKGRLDVVFANAGGGSLAPLGSITEELYDQTFNTNVKGVLFTVQKALPLIPDGGSIILNASIVPLGRMGRPEEIGKAAVFLASEDASFVAGVELFVDGGSAQV